MVKKSLVGAIVLAGAVLFSPIDVTANEPNLETWVTEERWQYVFPDEARYRVYTRFHRFTESNGNIVTYEELLNSYNGFPFISSITIEYANENKITTLIDNENSDLIIDMCLINGETTYEGYFKRNSSDSVVMDKAQAMFDDYLRQIRELKAEQAGL